MRDKYLYYASVSIACAVLASSPVAGAQQQGDAQEVDAQNPLTIPEGYRYDPAGRRDPFVNPVPPQAADGGPVVPEVRPPGLPGVLLNEAELSAIVRSLDPASSVVVIQAPGSRVFVAHRGDELYDVVIREIRGTDVIFEVKPLEGDDPLAPRALVARALTQEND